jgi:hypothetical protein
MEFGGCISFVHGISRQVSSPPASVPADNFANGLFGYPVGRDVYPESNKIL